MKRYTHAVAFESTTVEVNPECQAASEDFDASMQLAEMPEAKKKGRLARLVYEFETAGFKSSNGKIYPPDVFRKAVEAMQPEIERARVYGRNDHPSPFDDDRYQIKIADASHIVRSVEMASDTRVRVTIDVLDNDRGRQIMSIVNAEGNPAISQRAWALFREADDDDLRRYGLPDGDDALVADYLRLVTYDVVGRPGIHDADRPHASESNKEDPMDLTELKTKHPKLVDQIAEEAKRAERAAVEAEFESKKATIAEEAAKPLNEQIAAEQQKVADLTADLESVKKVLVKHGVVNEQITDEQAAERLSAAEAAKAAVENELKEAKTQLSEALDAKAKLDHKQAVADALEAVRTEYADHNHVDHIVEEVKARNIAKSEDALEAAKHVAELIEKVGGGKQGDGNEGAGGQGKPDPNDLNPNFQNSNGKQGGKPEGGDESAEARQHASAAAICSDDIFGM